MPRLPTRDDLGPLPSARTGAPVATFDTSAIARGVSDLGQGIASFGADLAEVTQKQQAYDAEARLQEFRWNEQLAFEKAKREVEPGQVENFAAGWQQEYFKRAKAFKKSVAPNLRGAVENELFSFERDFFLDAQKFQLDEQRRVASNTLMDAVANVYAPRARGVSTADLDGVIDDMDALLASNPHLSAIEKDEARRGLLREIGLAHIDGRSPGEVKRLLSGQGAANEAIAALSADDRIKLINRAEAEAERLQAKARAEALLARAARKDDMELAILSGEIRDEAQVLNDPVIDDGDKATLLRSLRTETDRRKNVEFVQSVLDEGGTVNIYDTNQRKALDKLYADNLGTLPETERKAYALDFVKRSGYAPDSLVKDVRSGLVSTDDNTLVNSLQMATDVTAANQRAFAGRDGEDSIEKAADFWRTHVGLGYAPQEIVKKFRESQDPEAQGKRKALLEDKQVKKWISEKAVPGPIKNLFDEGILDWGPDFVSPQQGSVIAGEYKVLLEDAMVETGGNKTAAEELAKARIAKVYGQSELGLGGSDIITRHPPEKYYPPIGGGHGYVVRQLRELVKNVDGVEPETVNLQPDQFTEADIKAGRIPRYQVWYVDAQGRRQQLLGGHFVPDLDEAREQATKQAKEDREKQRQLIKELDLGGEQNKPKPAVGGGY